jgi:hypothetical protein
MDLDLNGGQTDEEAPSMFMLFGVTYRPPRRCVFPITSLSFASHKLIKL